MHEPEVIHRARTLYVQTRSLTKVEKALKAEGFSVALSSLKIWKKEYNFQEAADTYDAKLAKYDEIALEVEKEIIVELNELRESLREQILQEADPQLIYSYLGVVKQTLELRNKDKLSEQAIINKVIELFLADPIAGPAVQGRKENVAKLLGKWKKTQ